MIITFQETGQDKCDDSGDGPQKNTTHFQKVWSSVEHYSREFVDSIKNTYRNLNQILLNTSHSQQKAGSLGLRT